MRRVERRPSKDEVAAATAVYAAAFREPPYCESADDVAALSERLETYAARGGFRLTLACVDERCVGMSLSVSAAEGDWWRDTAAVAVGPDAARWFGGRIREVVHLAVAPDVQRRGIGAALVADLLDDGDAHAVVLSCRPDAEAAQQLYLSAGFEVLTKDFRTAPGQLGYWLLARGPASRGRP